MFIEARSVSRQMHVYQFVAKMHEEIIDRADQVIDRRILQRKLPQMLNVERQPRIIDRPTFKLRKRESMVFDALNTTRILQRASVRKCSARG